MERYTLATQGSPDVELRFCDPGSSSDEGCKQQLMCDPNHRMSRFTLTVLMDSGSVSPQHSLQHRYRGAAFAVHRVRKDACAEIRGKDIHIAVCRTRDEFDCKLVVPYPNRCIARILLAQSCYLISKKRAFMCLVLRDQMQKIAKYWAMAGS